MMIRLKMLKSILPELKLPYKALPSAVTLVK
jgi:hypothetical protein